MSSQYKRFSRYLLLDHLFDGGMAEIYRARELTDQKTAQVGSKIVAIKLIKSEFSKDPDYKKMFEQELKTCFSLVHPNVVQTFDYGEKNDQLFAILEYVDGRNLKQFLNVISLQNKRFTIPMAVYIASQICLGLDYVHKFKDPLTGESFNLIHRDISPHNIMMSFDGLVKVIDFGIAKSDLNQDKTQTGIIKGKSSYLAPEYFNEIVSLDHRYDQFAVGLTLWELIFNKKLFDAKGQMNILKQIHECMIPVPKDYMQNVEIDQELSAILLKSLSKDPGERHRDMGAYYRSLSGYLANHFPGFNVSDLVSFTQDVFSTEIDRNIKKLKEFGTVDEGPYLEEYKKELAKGFREDKTHSFHDGLEKEKNTEILEKNASSLNIEKKHMGIGEIILYISVISYFFILLLFDLKKSNKYPKISEKINSFLPEIFNSKVSHLEFGEIILRNFKKEDDLFINGYEKKIDKEKCQKKCSLEFEIYKKVKMSIVGPNQENRHKEITLTNKNRKFEWDIPMAKPFYTGQLITVSGYSKNEFLEIEDRDSSYFFSLPIIKIKNISVGNYKAKLWNKRKNTFKLVKFTIFRDNLTTIGKRIEGI